MQGERKGCDGLGIKMKLRIICESCNQIINFEPHAYEEHIKKFHPKKVNVKHQYLNAAIERCIGEKDENEDK